MTSPPNSPPPALPPNGFDPPEPAPAPTFTTGAPPLSGAKNSATQHLCAAAYIDRRFRDAVIDEVYSRTDRAIAPNPGTDAVPILRHVLKARSLDLVQQAILAGLLLFLVCAPVVSKIGLLNGLVVWALIGIPFLVAETRSATPTGSISASAVDRLNRARISTIVLGILIALIVLFPMIPLLIVASLVDGGWTGGEAAQVAFKLGGGSGTVVLWLLVLGGVTATFGVLRARALMAAPAELEPAGPVDDRTRFIGEAQRSSVVTYHSGRMPFVGSGLPLATWQLAMTLRPADAPADGGTAMTIDPVGLNRKVKDRVERLGQDSAATKRLPGLVLSDHVYVSGRDTVGPVLHPHELRRSGYQFDSIEQIQSDPTTPVRHYLRCMVDSWGGELVTTVFLHCALQGETLYVEFSSCVLPPTPERYHLFGSGAASKETVACLGLLRGAAGMPLDLLRSPFDSIRNLARRMGSASRGGAKGVAGDHGAVAGIRELGTDIAEQNYFQYRDSIKYIEILERQILDALLDYLRENNVDVSELDERANTIVNNGVINYGKLQAGAAGAGSSANVGSIGNASRGTANGPAK